MGISGKNGYVIRFAVAPIGGKLKLVARERAYERSARANTLRRRADTATSEFGTKLTCCRSRLMSVVGGRTDLARRRPDVSD